MGSWSGGLLPLAADALFIAGVKNIRKIMKSIEKRRWVDQNVVLDDQNDVLGD